MIVKYRNVVEAVGQARVNAVLLTILVPIFLMPIPNRGENIFVFIPMVISLLFGVFLICIFCIDLVFIQGFNVLLKLTGYGRNKMIRDFELVSVFAIVMFYILIFWLAKPFGH